MNKRSIKLAENGIQVYVIEHMEKSTDGKTSIEKKIEKVFYSQDRANEYIKSIKG